MTPADPYDKIESAIDAPAEDRPYFIKQAIQVLPENHPAIEPLEAALAACGEHDDAARYTLRRAYGELPSPDGAGDSTPPVTRPPEGVRWLSEEWGAVTVVLSDAIIEWIDLVLDDDESVAEWITTTVWQTLDKDFITNHRFTADVEVEVPEDFALRAQLKARDRQRHGDDIDASEVAVNYMSWDTTFTLDGEELTAPSSTSDHEDEPIVDLSEATGNGDSDNDDGSDSA